MTLQEIKDNYAKEQDYIDWDDLCYYELDPELSTIDKKENIDRHIDEVCTLAQKQALERAVEKSFDALVLGMNEYSDLEKAITDESNLVI